MRGGRGLAIALAALLSASALHAQESGADGRVTYEAAFFQTFSPANALQIVERVPGFVLDNGDSEVRGFGQAAGNIVINGQRPSAKSETLETLLARIPAARVLRVEVAAGERFGSDYAGKPQVANIILSSAGGLAGTVEATMRREFTGVVIPEGSVSALLKRGASTFSLSAELDNSDSSERGTDRLTALPGGTEIEFRDKTNRIKNPIGKLSAGWALEEGKHRNAHVNMSLTVDRFRLDQIGHIMPADAPAREDTLLQDYLTRTVELSGDVSRPWLGGGIKLVGLATRRFRDRDDTSLLGVDTVVQGGFLQTQRDWREESVLRLSWARDKLAGWGVELGVEGAFNRLNSLVDYAQVNAGGGATRVDLPIDQAVVEEYRGEAFANAGRDIAHNVHLDLGLTFEASRLTVRGDATAERTLRFLKPKATLDWHPGAWHAQLSVQRTVAQLHFEDFISVAEINNDRVNGGNADLLPQRAWELLASADRKILGDGRVKLEAGYNFVAKVQDRIPTPQGFDAPGNLGDGSQLILRSTVDLPLGKLGIKGGRLSFYGSYVGTSVRDPYNGRNRRFSGFRTFYFNSEFRQDLGRFAWGLYLEGMTVSTAYRRDELDSVYSQPWMSGFVEYRPSARLTLTAGVENLIDSNLRRERDFFLPDRTSAAPYANEERFRTKHLVVYFTIKRSFG